MFGKEKVIEKLQKEVADMKETLQLYEFRYYKEFLRGVLKLKH